MGGGWSGGNRVSEDIEGRRVNFGDEAVARLEKTFVSSKSESDAQISCRFGSTRVGCVPAANCMQACKLQGGQVIASLGAGIQERSLRR